MAAIAKDPYEVKESPNPMQEAQSRLLSGKYVLLSWDALNSLLRDDNHTEFTLTSELVTKCSFLAKEAFTIQAPLAFRAAAQPPKGIEQATQPNDKRFGLLEEIKLRPFLKKEHFLTDEARIFISNDLLDDLARPLTAALLEKCIFVSKQVFDPRKKKKYACEVNDGHPHLIKVDKLSTAIRSIKNLKDASEAPDDEADEAQPLLYAILTRG